jgi:hypothetical protein
VKAAHGSSVSHLREYLARIICNLLKILRKLWVIESWQTHFALKGARRDRGGVFLVTEDLRTEQGCRHRPASPSLAVDTNQPLVKKPWLDAYQYSSTFNLRIGNDEDRWLEYYYQ